MKRKEVSNGSGSSKWVFTLNNPVEPYGKNFLENYGTLSFIGYSLEKAPTTGTLHYQGVMIFKKSLKLAELRKIRGMPNGIHLEIMLGTFEQAYEQYCKKQETHEGGPWEFGEKPKGRGKRTDIANLKASIDAGASDQEIAEEHFGAFLRYYRGIGAYRLLTATPRSSQTEVVVYWGPSGVGKTHHVEELAGPDAYWLSEPNGRDGGVWWDGYRGQDVVVIDEFYGWIRRNQLQRILDHSPYRVQTKGGTVEFKASRVYIISNEPPSRWYKRIGLGALERRLAEPIGHVFYFGGGVIGPFIEEAAYLSTLEQEGGGSVPVPHIPNPPGLYEARLGGVSLIVRQQ